MNNLNKMKSLKLFGDLIVDGSITAGGPFTVGELPLLPVVGGQATITGSGQIPTGLTSINAVSVSLGQDAGLGASHVSATWSGSMITVRVTKPTSATNATPVPATVATVINWLAIGS